MRAMLMLALPLASVAAVGAAVLVHPGPKAPSLDDRSHIGIAEFESGHLERGRRTLQGVVATDPQHAGALVGLALAALREGREPDAERYLDLALQRDPTSFRVHLARAIMFRRRRANDRARTEFEAAHRFQPLEPSPVYNLAVMAMERDDLRLARDLYLEYLKLAPGASDEAEVQATLGDIGRRLAGGAQQ